MTKTAVDLLRKEIEVWVSDLFARYQKPELVYHNLEHTQNVVNRSMEIAKHYALNNEELFILYAAAWFHDTGHLFAEQERHEEESVQLTSRFFSKYSEVSPIIVVHIERAILSTKMPQVPCTRLEDILYDADTYHLGTPEFFITNERVKEEMQARGVNTDNWNTSSLMLLEQHQFHTAYCESILIAGKKRNIALLRLKIG